MATLVADVAEHDLVAAFVQDYLGSRCEQFLERVELLSDREQEVFLLVGKGLGTKQIANQLRLSPKTIETYLDLIKKKLKLRNMCDVQQLSVLHSMVLWVRERAN